MDEAPMHLALRHNMRIIATCTSFLSLVSGKQHSMNMGVGRDPILFSHYQRFSRTKVKEEDSTVALFNKAILSPWMKSLALSALLKIVPLTGTQWVTLIIK